MTYDEIKPKVAQHYADISAFLGRVTVLSPMEIEVLFHKLWGYQIPGARLPELCNLVFPPDVTAVKIKDMVLEPCLNCRHRQLCYTGSGAFHVMVASVRGGALPNTIRPLVDAYRTALEAT